MIDLYGVLQEQETVNGELGLGVDYYKGEPGAQGIPGKDGSDQVYVGADEPTDERVKLWIDTDATPPSKAVSWDEIENKPEIPAPYTLPTASTSTLGGVKVDGSTITIADGVISANGSSEPDAYIKDASVSGNTLTLTKKDNTEVVFTPSGGSSSGVSGYYFDPTATLTNDDKSHIIEIFNNKNIPMFIGQYSVIRMFMAVGHMYFCVLSPNGSVSNEILVYTLQATNAAELKITSDKFIINQSYSLLANTDGGNVLTSNNWQNYISIGGSDEWNYTDNIWDSNLYNAKELIFVIGNSGSNMVDSAQCYYNFSKDSTGGETTLGGSFSNCRYYLKTENSNIYWEYTGSAINVYNNSESYYFLYKT